MWHGWSGWGHGMMGMGGMGLLASLLGLLLFVALLGGLVLLAVFLIRQYGRSGSPNAPRSEASDPMALVRRRLAAGEITIEEFEEIRRRLED